MYRLTFQSVSVKEDIIKTLRLIYTLFYRRKTFYKLAEQFPCLSISHLCHLWDQFISKSLFFLLHTNYETAYP